MGSGSGIGVVNPELGTEDAIIEKTLLSIQEKVSLASMLMLRAGELSSSV